MRPDFVRRLLCLLTSLAAMIPAGADFVVTDGEGFGVDVSPADGRIAMDVMGSIWTLPGTGGEAQQLTDGLIAASSPRWSPDGTALVYQVRGAGGTSIWQFQVDSGDLEQLSNPAYHDQDASWHPGGERIVFSSARNDSGLDLWETDLPTGLSWRLSHRDGDETEPVWSRNGRHLAYIHRSADRFALMLRRSGQADVELVTSSTPLSSPSWRPDGSLITYLHHGTTHTSLEMVILSEPPLVRRFAYGEDFFSAPVSWADRNRFYYAADGVIKTRQFDDRRSRTLPFRAMVRNESAQVARTVPNRDLALLDPPRGPIVLRGARLFDGIWPGYREQMDVLIEGGQVISVEPRRDWQDVQILDVGDVTLLPGLIDAWSEMPATLDRGAALLAYGVTTIVADRSTVAFDDAEWHGEAMPGPRVLPSATVSATTPVSDEVEYFLVNFLSGSASIEENRLAMQSWRDHGVPIIADNWSVGRQLGADILLGADSMRGTNRQGQNRQYENAAAASYSTPPQLISALADSVTPGISALLNSRQATILHHRAGPPRRLGGQPQLSATAARIVAGSRPNGLPPGLALHAELRALQAAGLSGEKVLLAAGKNAAVMLGVDNQLGTITPGAMADLVLVSGDPLADIADVLNIVAVVRNGRFFSQVSLLERAEESIAVE